MPQLPLFVQVAAGVVIGGLVLWGLLLGYRLQQYRISFWTSAVFACVLIGLCSLELREYQAERKVAESGCGANDPLCILN